MAENTGPVPDPADQNTGSRIGEQPLTILLLHGRGTDGPGPDWTRLVHKAIENAASIRARRRSLTGTPGRTVRIVAPSYASITRGTPKRRPRLRNIALPEPSGLALPTRPRLQGLRADLQQLWSRGPLAKEPGRFARLAADLGSPFMRDFHHYTRTPKGCRTGCGLC